MLYLSDVLREYKGRIPEKTMEYIIKCVEERYDKLTPEVYSAYVRSVQVSFENYLRSRGG